MSRIVIYYSKTGNTKRIAEEYAGKNNTEIYGIVDLVKRNGLWGYMKSKFQARIKKRTPIEKPYIDICEYSRIILCMPVWEGTIPSPMRTFLTDYGDKINKIEYIILHSNKRTDYKEIFFEIDKLIRKQRVKSKSIFIDEKLSLGK